MYVIVEYFVGVAGLAAARTILDSGGGHTVTVLEARSRVGGRIWTLTQAEAQAKSPGVNVVGGEVDMGASWCHGCG
jgi:polyamine oxidase